MEEILITLKTYTLQPARKFIMASALKSHNIKTIFTDEMQIEQNEFKDNIGISSSCISFTFSKLHVYSEKDRLVYLAEFLVKIYQNTRGGWKLMYTGI